jgi:AcrR family transcriptional regulator
MDAAQEVFLAKGFDAASVDEIVKAANVAKGTFYFYFKTKEDVLLALRARFVENFHARLLGAVNAKAPEDLVGRLDAWIAAGVNGYLDEFELHDLVFHEFRPSNRRRERDNPIVAHLTSLIVSGGKAGAWKVRNARLTAVMISNALHGAVDDEIVAPVKSNRVRLVADVSAFCRLALRLSAR